MTMPGFTAEASLDANRAQCNTTTVRSLTEGAAIRPQLPCGVYVTQLKHHYRDLVEAVARQDWDVVDIMLNAVRRDQQSIEIGC
jgi:hypothetical protein